MISTLRSFKEKLSMLVMQLERRELKHFKNMADKSKQRRKLSYNRYVENIIFLLKEFERKFVEISKLNDIVIFLSYSFNVNINIEEVVNLKCDALK